MKVLLINLSVLILMFSPKETKGQIETSDGYLQAEYMLKQDSLFQTLIESNFPVMKDSKNQNNMIRFLGERWNRNDSIRLRKLDSLENHYSDFYTTIFNTPNSLILNKNQIEFFNSEVILKVKDSKGGIVDLALANRKDKKITIYENNKDNYEQFMFLKGFFDDEYSILPIYFLLCRKFLSGMTDISYYDILEMTEAQCDTILKNNQQVLFNYQLIPEMYIMIHEFAHIYLNTPSEYKADSLALTELGKIFKTMPDNESKLYASQGISEVLIFYYINNEYEQRIRGIRDRSKNSELIKRNGNYFTHLLSWMEEDDGTESGREIYITLKNSLNAFSKEKLFSMQVPFTECDMVIEAFSHLAKYKRNRNPTISLNNLEKGLELLLEATDSEELSERERELLHLIIARLYDSQKKKFNEAIEHYKKALKIGKSIITKEYYDRAFKRIDEQKAAYNNR